MKDIGIVICNYNKKDFVLNCIESVINAKGDNYDILVVDNASTDGSPEAIRERYGTEVGLIVNSENLGGAGGFDTGLKEVMKNSYRYYMLMDNDIVIDEDAIVNLYGFMESPGNSQVGMVGSKVYFMDEPNVIWGYGGIIDFQDYIQKDKYKNRKDDEDIPEVSFCDYVAACSLMVRAEAVKKVGIMPEENFIYWDDMEWGYRFNEAGYKVCVYGKSKVWHKAGGRNAGNTFIHYYMWRNRIRFFQKVISPDKKKDFEETVLSEMFRMVYSLKLKGEDNVIRSLMMAFDDAIHGISGKAEEGRILPRPEVKNRLAEYLYGKNHLLIEYNGHREGFGNIMRIVKKTIPDAVISVTFSNPSHGRDEAESLQHQYPGLTVADNEEGREKRAYDGLIRMCDHIFKLSGEVDSNYAYVDPWCNIIFGEKDIVYAKSYEQTKDLFVLCKGALCK